MTTREPWPASLTHAIAGQIKRHRTGQKLSTQQLSDACSKIGMDIPRTLITDLEIGRRAHISVAELLVIARALDVPPLLLIFPVGTSTGTEVLPGQDRPAFRAAQWFSGEGSFPGADDAGTVIAASPQNYGQGWPLVLYRAHDRAFEDEMRAMGHARQLDAQAATAGTTAEREALAAAAAAQRDLAGKHRTEGARLREAAEARGIDPPGLVMSLRIPQTTGKEQAS